MCSRCGSAAAQGSVPCCTHPTQGKCWAQAAQAQEHGEQSWEAWLMLRTASRAQVDRAAAVSRGNRRAPSCNTTSVFILPTSAEEAEVTSLVFCHSAALPSPFLWQEQHRPGPWSL